MTVVLHTSGEPACTGCPRGVLRELDPELAALRRPDDGGRDAPVDGHRAHLFDGCWRCSRTLALVLALGGAYGVARISWRSARARLAFASRSVRGRVDIVRAALRSSLRPIGRRHCHRRGGRAPHVAWLSSLLFGVNPHDAPVLSLAVFVLLATAILANGLPAMRARRIHPMHSLRIGIRR